MDGNRQDRTVPPWDCGMMGSAARSNHEEENRGETANGDDGATCERALARPRARLRDSEN